MLDYKKYFENKKITKQGFGILGRGFGVVKFLIDSGADLIVTDIGDESKFEKQKNEILNYIKINNLKNNIEFVFGEHRLEDFENVDLVIQASGVPKNNKFLEHAKSKSVEVLQEISIFLRIIRDANEKFQNKIKVIGVTGTRGKTTTTYLIYNLMRDAYGENRVYLGGNIQGVSTLELLNQINEGDVVVLELDSWLLQGLKEIEYSPDFAIFTNFMQDHMNYYLGNMKEYFEDKANIFKFQTSKDYLFTSSEMIEISTEYGVNLEDIKSNKIILEKEKIEEINLKYKSKLLGEHNKYYIALAVELARVLNINENVIKNTIQGFNGVKYRMELIRELNRVKYINDTTATTPEALVAALDTYTNSDGTKSVILISGGRDKDIDLKNLIKKLFEKSEIGKLKKIILLSNETTTGTQRLLKLISEEVDEDDTDRKVEMQNNLNITEVSSLSEALNLAIQNASSGDVILFSPGFASFGMFLNEYDRGEKFENLVQSFK
jgi:UDP-N-acetylmuramoylalanine--D-glutamate ligase